MQLGMHSELQSMMRDMMSMHDAMLGRMFGTMGGPHGSPFGLLGGFPGPSTAGGAFPGLGLGTGMGMGMGMDGMGPSGGAVMYSSQQVFSSSDPTQNYSRTTTAQAGPSGIMESRTAVRDAREGVERINIRRQLGDRYSEVERARHMGSGQETINKTVHNVENDDMDRFDQEWRAHATQNLPLYRSGASVPPPVPRLEGTTDSLQAPLAIADRPYYTPAPSAAGLPSYSRSGFPATTPSSGAYPSALPRYSSPGATPSYPSSGPGSYHRV